ncbi:uncharacterized protein CC84DRAFT_665299 [Paraphaeosphaeria sporulosa]|uniref:BZIP domain-containing protein n=1 Tax=Paraphaeosphaeria sporulosa TaxID=1460663 RepID=A0A177CKW2_9PLEO|nr:uncharacterized protein CC84DRAFT_665299 [Paraphaeosphaeria sporulosa]OAG07508.1 hypothetical protein CC84DRAFT_665299 [Paraphaeosphaeria sporulosa]
MSAYRDESQRARKRATDRKSQRNHRERQRAYVQQLEQSLATLKAAAHSDQLVSSLLAEIDRLQKKCTTLEAQVARIRAVVCDHPESAGEEAPVGDTHPGLSLDVCESGRSDQIGVIASVDDELSAMGVAMCAPDVTLAVGDGCLSVEDCSMSAFDWDPSAGDGILQAMAPIQTLGDVEPIQNVTDVCFKHFHTRRTSIQGPLVPLSNACLTTSTSPGLPRYTAAAGEADIFLLAARQACQNGQLPSREWPFQQHRAK